MWSEHGKVRREPTKLFGMIQRGQLSRNGRKLPGLLDNAGEEFSGNGPAREPIHCYGGQALAVWGIARDTDNCDTLPRQSAKRRLDVTGITRRNKNAIEFFLGIRGEHFHIAFIESCKIPENDINVDAIRNGSRGTNAGAE
jgi:hypothetical protein